MDVHSNGVSECLVRIKSLCAERTGQQETEWGEGPGTERLVLFVVILIERRYAVLFLCVVEVSFFLCCLCCSDFGCFEFQIDAEVAQTSFEDFQTEASQQCVAGVAIPLSRYG